MRYIILFVLISASAFAMTANTTSYSVESVALGVFGTNGSTENYSFTQNSAVTPLLIHTEAPPPDDTPPGGSPGSSRAPSSAPATIPSTQVSVSMTEKMLFTDVTSGQIIKMELGSINIPVTLVEVEMKNDVKGVCGLSVNALTTKPSTIGREPPNLYRYLDINRINLRNSDIGKAYITFAVDRAWLEENGINENNVVLLHLGEDWMELNTTKIKSGIKDVTYKAECDSFSIFAISAKAASPASPIMNQSIQIPMQNIEIPIRDGNDTSIDDIEDTLPTEKGSTGMTVWIGAAVLGGILALFLILFLATRSSRSALKNISPYQQSQKHTEELHPIIAKIMDKEDLSAHHPEHVQNAHTEKSALDEYISRERSKGFKDDAIKQQLLSAGWPAYLIDKALS